MAQIHNTDLFKELKDGAKLQQLHDVIPSQLADKVVPVMEVNPRMLRRANVVRGISSAATGNITVYTTPTDRNFYLTSITIALIKDATCDMASGVVVLTLSPFSQGAINIVGIPTLVTTAQSIAISKDFSIPILLERGSTIVLAQNAAYSVGLMVKTAHIVGYFEDNSGA